MDKYNKYLYTQNHKLGKYAGCLEEQLLFDKSQEEKYFKKRS
jgi:hypothetical protein